MPFVILSYFSEIPTHYLKTYSLQIPLGLCLFTAQNPKVSSRESKSLAWIPQFSACEPQSPFCPWPFPLQFFGVSTLTSLHFLQMAHILMLSMWLCSWDYHCLDLLKFGCVRTLFAVTFCFLKLSQSKSVFCPLSSYNTAIVLHLGAVLLQFLPQLNFYESPQWMIHGERGQISFGTTVWLCLGASHIPCTQ